MALIDSCSSRTLDEWKLCGLQGRSEERTWQQDTAKIKCSLWLWATRMRCGFTGCIHVQCPNEDYTVYQAVSRLLNPIFSVYYWLHDWNYLSVRLRQSWLMSFLSKQWLSVLGCACLPLQHKFEEMKRKEKMKVGKKNWREGSRQRNSVEQKHEEIQHARFNNFNNLAEENFSPMGNDIMFFFSLVPNH